MKIDETLFADNVAQIGGAILAKSSEVVIRGTPRYSLMKPSRVGWEPV